MRSTPQTSSLTPHQHGEDGARELGRRLHGIRFSHVLTSPLQRSRKTCELAGLSKGSRLEPDLAEWDYGEYEQRRSEDIHLEYPCWTIFHHGCPGGESPQEVSDRADRLISRLRELDGNVALFSHGHFGRVLGLRWIGLPSCQGVGLLLGPTSLSVLGYGHNQRDEPAIEVWNSSSDSQLRRDSSA